MIRLPRRSIESVPIDIAPLIDIVFQVLLFFMLTSSFVLMPGIRVNLPAAKTGEVAGGSNLVITLTKEHLIYLDNELVTWQELEERLTQVSRQTPVLIWADRYAYVDKLIALWDLCRDIGYQQVKIATVSE